MLEVNDSAFTESPGNAMDVGDVVVAFGCLQRDLAEHYGITESAITRWAKRSVPLNKAFDLAHLSKGKLTVGLHAIRVQYDDHYPKASDQLNDKREV